MGLYGVRLQNDKEPQNLKYSFLLLQLHSILYGAHPFTLAETDPNAQAVLQNLHAQVIWLLEL